VPISSYEEVGERPDFKGQKISTNLYIKLAVAQNKYNNSTLQKKLSLSNHLTISTKR